MPPNTIKGPVSRNLRLLHFSITSTQSLKSSLYPRISLWRAYLNKRSKTNVPICPEPALVQSLRWMASRVPVRRRCVLASWRDTVGHPHWKIFPVACECSRWSRALSDRVNLPWQIQWVGNSKQVSTLTLNVARWLQIRELVPTLKALITI
jgi:hypothetical protein